MDNNIPTKGNIHNIDKSAPLRSDLCKNVCHIKSETAAAELEVVLAGSLEQIHANCKISL